MEVKQTQAAEQQLILTQDMQQSLHILQLAQPICGNICWRRRSPIRCWR